MEENGIFINEHWHTGQVRDASSELVGTGLKVVDHLLPKVQEINPNLHYLVRAALIKTILDPKKIPHPTINKWDHDEYWVYRVIDSLRRKYTTPKRLDKAITSNLDNYGYFSSPQDAVDYFSATQRRLAYLLESGTQRGLGTLKTAILAYTESRVLRMAVREGQYLIPPTN